MKKHYFLQILFKVRDELPMLTIVKNHFYPRSDQNIEIQPQIKYTSANHRCVSYVCDVCFQIDRFDCHTYLFWQRLVERACIRLIQRTATRGTPKHY